MGAFDDNSSVCSTVVHQTPEPEPEEIVEEEPEPVEPESCFTDSMNNEATNENMLFVISKHKVNLHISSLLRVCDEMAMFDGGHF